MPAGVAASSCAVSTYALCGRRTRKAQTSTIFELQSRHMPDAPHPARILVVDDDARIRALLQRILAKDGHAIDMADNGVTALAAIERQAPDVILSDVTMPEMDGFELCHRLKLNVATRLIPVVLVTGLADRDNRIKGVDIGADEFLTKPVDPQELRARVRSLMRLKRYTDDLDSAASIIMALAVMVEARDGHTEGHCYRMANYATALGRQLGLGQDDLQTLHRGGFLHDIGMLAIPDAVLRRPGRLEPEEFELVKSHTVIGDQLCGNLRSLQAVRPIVRHHHERYDGSGYPDGLSGDAIPLVAQIIGIVDVYDAVTTQRPYQRASSIEQAIAVLRQQAEWGWRRRQLVEDFVTVVKSGRLDTYHTVEILNVEC
jgi:putative two-component system response regulator